ncbi:cytosine deaminase [Gordonia sp. (in: high G+C Gram-positive bacteria)]|jgi:cytosine deaminase|uniref:cytosine deaminase n=1 Tax=Gordonia sp. (in: high G+C Gram-positive bacteria) TaxID=84139 RepID=UPI0025B7AB53|nr:cytosine deaminase [Gordonia sp. (in: high G+C Gram-positive bacteria)]HMS75443.1 cytosine deaminase [Gordonia sp. (in: high G+C Gram-positive bacteria)]
MPLGSAPLRGITARLGDGSLVDLDLTPPGDSGVRVARIGAASRTPEDQRAESDWLTLPDHVLFGAAAEPHAHLDKALSWNELHPPLGDLRAAIATWTEGAAHFTEESYEHRARRAALMMLGNGYTAIRTHVNAAAPDDPTRAVRAINRVRDELAGLIAIQIVFLPASTVADDVVHAALDAGADLVGGAPHLADDPLTDLHRLLDIAEARGVGTDMHIDEFLQGDHLTINAYADRVASWPADRIRTASHCSRLSTLSPAELADVTGRLASAHVGVVALPITNLYLQGHDGPGRGQRAIAPIGALRAGGVEVCAGADNLRDPFNPLGRADPLETAALSVVAAHQSPHDAIDLVTGDVRRVLGLEPAGPVVGARADFLAVRGTDVVDVIAAAPADRVVIVGGVVVARTETHRDIAFGSHAPPSTDLDQPRPLPDDDRDLTEAL